MTATCYREADRRRFVAWFPVRPDGGRGADRGVKFGKPATGAQIAVTAAHTDIVSNGWIDRRVPPAWRPYLRLARLDRPIGTWLLLFPCWWSIALASPGLPDLGLMVLFAIGAVVMRGAGCTVNDMMDRNIDAAVERTRGRPLPSGQVTLRQALVFLAAQLLVGLVVLVQLNRPTIALGAASLLLVFTYPLMKRITGWPQAFLGLTFNWGALLGWVAVTGSLATAPVLLYAAGFFWTLGYDTIYAHQDKADDARIGIGSTALMLGDHSKIWIAGFYSIAYGLLMAAGTWAGLSFAYRLGLAVALLQLIWQWAAWNPDDRADSLDKFRSNRWFGWLVLGAIIIGATL